MGETEDLYFTAEMARELVDVNCDLTSELQEVTDKIVGLASSGKRKLVLYKSVSEATVTELKKRGFEMPAVGAVSMQKDGVYHIIYW